MPVKGGYLFAAGGGVILLWSGVRGHKWSTVLKDVLSGNKISSTKELSIESSSAAFGYGSGSGALPNTGVGGSAAKNKAIARVLTVPYGWSTGQQWDDLDKLWTKESNWDNKIRNASSGAYGIPQSLPASKMGAAANPPLSSATAQIAWGLRYIKTTYQSPSGAWAHELSNNWY